MCKKCVQALDSIGTKMSEYLRDGFDAAIRRDLSPEMNDEEGMFHLLVYEIIAEEVKEVVDLNVMDWMAEQIVESIFNGASNGLMRVFQQEWS